MEATTTGLLSEGRFEINYQRPGDGAVVSFSGKQEGKKTTVENLPGSAVSSRGFSENNIQTARGWYADSFTARGKGGLSLYLLCTVYWVFYS